jgi:hypothetical protein
MCARHVVGGRLFLNHEGSSEFSHVIGFCHRFQATTAKKSQISKKIACSMTSQLPAS